MGRRRASLFSFSLFLSLSLSILAKYPCSAALVLISHNGSVSGEKSECAGGGITWPLSVGKRGRRSTKASW